MAENGMQTFEQQAEEANLLIDVRNGCFIFIGACTVVVLAMTANFLTLQPTALSRDFLIFSVIVCSVTIICLISLLARSQPRIDVLVLFLLCVGWVALGSWTTDIIAHIQCVSLSGQRIQTKTGSMSSEVWCREMKTILAFSWTTFAILTIKLVLIVILVIRAVSQGREGIWGGSMTEVPWFNQFGNGGPGMGMGTGMGQGNQFGQYGYSNLGPYAQQSNYAPSTGRPAMSQYAVSDRYTQQPYPTRQAGTYQSGPNQYTVNQAPGHAIVISGNGSAGGMPNITQQPGMMRA
ncbi:hypothetical protein SISNIDRAFT_130910 [Sistotremastrum niveocremeum HHB9708]|uniref:MARVEL domain-containing protein n=2 Tax=Sistotremastraceae TaxID=3402574 RepID=A0A164T381_9AGAM|nr:hypothetical protein SISNIDRAFT_130910 [Sistotremastrum niveocremeum HHB9708]KZT34015.1 hypothetical protein SISSUDRAFT_359240 [Sistotremastrum suecicum HHB10207 ss-3]